MDVGQRIAFFRKKKGYSVNKLANLAGVSQSYLREIELGQKNPTVSFVSLICDALDISLKIFFDEESTDITSNDLLAERIYHMNSSQKKALLNFLNTLHL